MILSATPLDNPAPELTRLRAALSIDWDSYRAWLDSNWKAINELADETEANGEEPLPIIRAHYVFERTMLPYAPVIQPEADERTQTAHGIGKTRSVAGWLRAMLTAALSLSAMGCATLRTPTQTPDNFPSAALEGVYQIANAYDFATTVNIARRPDCYHEVGFPTHAIIGTHPSVGSVEAYGVLQGIAHFAISHWLDREVDATDSNGWRAARIAWHVITIGVSVRQDVINSNIGLRPFGAGAAPQCERLP